MLDIKHFFVVRDLIWGARSSYRNLGFALGVTPDVVTTIIQTNLHDVERCFDAVLTEVLNKGVMQEDLAIALESQVVRHGQLAQKVREATFTPGNSEIIHGQSVHECHSYEGQ